MKKTKEAEDKKDKEIEEAIVLLRDFISKRGWLQERKALDLLIENLK